MNTLIANQYGRVQGEAGGCGLTLCVTAQTPRRESVELQTHVDSVEQQLHLLAILRAAGPVFSAGHDHEIALSATCSQPNDCAKGLVCGYNQTVMAATCLEWCSPIPVLLTITRRMAVRHNRTAT